jgi:hypothetical protein
MYSSHPTTADYAYAAAEEARTKRIRSEESYNAKRLVARELLHRAPVLSNPPTTDELVTSIEALYSALAVLLAD